MTLDHPPAHPEFEHRSNWLRTGDYYFPYAASVDDQWWVLRLNNFPDHPLFTLFVDGARRFDVEDAPPNWRPLSPDSEGPELEPGLANDVLRPIWTFTTYGSEVGRPCDGLFCCDGHERQVESAP